MKREILLILISFFTSGLSKAQIAEEVVLGGPNDESCYGGVRLGNNLYFSMGEDQDYLDWPLNSPKVYKAGKGLSLLDSCFIADSLNLSYTVRLNHMDKLTDSSFICLLGDTAHYFAVELDTSLNLINSIPISFGGDTVIGNFECVYPDGDKLLIGGSMGREPNRPWLTFPFLISVNQNSGRVKPLFAEDSLGNYISSIIRYNDKLLVAIGSKGADFAFASLDSSFALDSIYKYVPILPAGMPRSSNLLAKNAAGNLVSLGYEGIYGCFSMVQYDSTLTPIQRDSLPAFNDLVYIGSDSFIKSSDNSFFVTATIDPVGNSGELQPGMFRELMVWKISENGQMLWEKAIVDSSYRLATQLISGRNGGVYIVSSMYDPNTYMDKRTDLSIIRLDSSGSFVDLEETEFAFGEASNISVYPNPASGEVQIEGFADESNLAVRLYNLNGVKVWDADIAKKRKIDVSGLPAGVYTLEMEDKELGSSTTAKLLVR